MKHTELIARLEAAEVGSKALDADIHVAVADDPNTYVVEPHPDSMFSHKPGWYRTGNDLSVQADPVTTSLDSALALAKRVGCRPYMADFSIDGWPSWLLKTTRDVEVTDPETGEALSGPYFSGGRAKTPALALCIAILRALDANN